MGKVTKKQKDAYNMCLEYLCVRVDIAPDKSLQDLMSRFSALTEFYERDEQTDICRMGIQIVLSLIQTDNEYTTFLQIHKELLKVWIDLKANVGIDRLYYGPYSFFSFIRQNPMQAIELLHAADRVYRIFGPYTHQVLQCMFTMGAYVAADFEADTGVGKFVNFIIRRTDHFLHGFYHTCKTLSLSGIQIDWTHAGTMVPTDGDMHCGGQIPYVVVWNQRKWVYKPHNMRTECLVAVAMQFFSGLLEKSAENCNLRVLDTYLLADRTGLMEFAIRTESMNEDQAVQYFKKFGALLCFAKLFGIVDLHSENIMATVDGPVIIDLECALDRYEIKSQTFSNTSLSLIIDAFKRKKLDNTTFFVDGQIPLFTAYEAHVIQGFQIASTCCKANKELLIQYYRDLLYSNLLSEPFMHRVVPYATKEFYDEMYHVIQYFNEPDSIRNALRILFKDHILPPLYNICCNGLYIVFDVFMTYVDMKILSDSIYRDLFYGDIPIFHLKYELDAQNNVYQTGYIDHQSFFTQAICIGPLDNLVKEFESQIEWLISAESLRALQEFIERSR